MTGTPIPEDIRDLYKVAVEMADRVSARRGQANQFYLSIQTLLLGVPAVFKIDPLWFGGSVKWTMVILSAVGIIGSATWWLQLRSYRDLNAAKFSVINEIEQNYFVVKPFTDEWAILDQDRIRWFVPRYAELGVVERVMPIAFVVINLAVLIGGTA